MPYISPIPKQVSDIDAARAIASRRSYLKKSGSDIEQQTQGVIYQKLLSRLETAKKPVSSMKITELIALIRALEWTPQEFSEHTGVDLSGLMALGDPQFDPFNEHKLNLSYIYKHVHSPDVLHDEDSKPLHKESAAIPRRVLEARGIDSDSIITIKADESVFISEGVKNIGKSLSFADSVTLDIKTPPYHSDVVVLFEPEKRHLIVKLYTESSTSGHIIFSPLRSSVAPIIRSVIDDDLVYKGIVIWRGGSFT